MALRGSAGRWLVGSVAAGSLLATLIGLTLELDGRRAYSVLPVADVTGVCGTLREDATPTSGAMRYRLLVTQVAGLTAGTSGEAAAGGARVELALRVPGVSAERLYAGQRVCFEPVAVAGGVGGSGGTRADASADAGARGWVGRGSGAVAVQVLGWADGVAATRAGLRRRLEHALERQGRRAGALLRALLLGDRFVLQRNVTTAFRNSGSMHLLALSGLHVGMAWTAAALVAGLLRRVGVALLPAQARWWDTLGALVAVLAVLGYVALAGPRPSLVRAASMATFAQAARLLGRRPSAVDLLALAAIVVLVADPGAASELSFQLSFLALLGILLLGPSIALHLPGVLPPTLRAVLGVTFGAQLLTLPLVLGAFGVARPIGALAGVLLVPLTALFLGTGVLAAAAAALTQGASLVATEEALGVLYSALVAVNRWFGLVPGIEL
jgi:competence protein ComEC